MQMDSRSGIPAPEPVPVTPLPDPFILDPPLFFLYPTPTMKTKTKKQVAYLLSKVSPMSDKQQGKLKGELHSGDVKIKPKK